MFQYASPKMFDALQLTVAIVPGEGRTAVDDATDTEKGVADTWYASAVYESKLFYGSVSHAGHEAGGLKFDGPTAAVDIIRGAVSVEPVTDLEIGALIQQAKGVDQDNETTGTRSEEHTSELQALMRI